MNEGEAYARTLDAVEDIIKGITNKAVGAANIVVSVVQFSGIKQLEKDYVPGTGRVNGMDMYKIEVAPTLLTEDPSDRAGLVRTLKRSEGLDGNGQLFLALQDLSMEGFLAKMGRESELEDKQARKRILIAFTDEEWDIKNLSNAFGSGTTDKDTVMEHVHEVIIILSFFEIENIILGLRCRIPMYSSTRQR